MPTEQNTLLHRWFEEVWNRKNSSAIRELLDEDCLHHGLTGPGGPPVHGYEAFEQFHAAFLDAFPDLHVEVNDVIAADDKIAARFTVTGTQKGPLQGQAATGKKVKFTGGGMCATKDGKFVEVWNEIDFPKMQYDLSPDTPDIE